MKWSRSFPRSALPSASWRQESTCPCSTSRERFFRRSRSFPRRRPEEQIDVLTVLQVVKETLKVAKAISQEHYSEHIAAQSVEMPVQVVKETLEVVKNLHQECSSEHIVVQSVEEALEVVKVTSQGHASERIVEQMDDMPVPQAVDAGAQRIMEYVTMHVFQEMNTAVTEKMKDLMTECAEYAERYEKVTETISPLMRHAERLGDETEKMAVLAERLADTM